jgi:hypothetical protein
LTVAGRACLRRAWRDDFRPGYDTTEQEAAMEAREGGLLGRSVDMLAADFTRQ